MGKGKKNVTRLVKTTPNTSTKGRTGPVPQPRGTTGKRPSTAGRRVM